MTNGNANYFPWEETKEDNTLPTGMFHCIWQEADLTESQSGKTMIKNQYIVKLPQEYAGQNLFDYMVLGSDEQPNAIVPGAMGTRQFKKAVIAAQIPASNDINQLIMNAKGSELMLSVFEKVEEKGDFAGQKRNNINGYYKVGEREAKIAPAQGTAPMPTGAAAPTPPPLGAAPAAAPAAPVAPATPAATTPGAVETPAAPATPPAPETPAAPATPAAGGQTVRCTICQMDVSMADFGAHVASHAQG